MENKLSLALAFFLPMMEVLDREIPASSSLLSGSYQVNLLEKYSAAEEPLCFEVPGDSEL